MSSETDGDDPLDRVLSSLSLLVVDDRAVGKTLGHIATLARDGIGPADYAAVTTMRDGRPETTVATDPVIEAIDQAQYDANNGPCLDAFRSGEVHRIDSTEDDARWPEFADAAVSRGIHSTLSFPLMARGESIGVLNLYSRRPHSFSPADEAHGLRFAQPAAVLLTNANLFWETRQLAENLEAALASRAVIEQAKGILMAQEGIDAEKAFDILRRVSQRENVKLREVAQRLVDRATGQSGTR